MDIDLKEMLFNDIETDMLGWLWWLNKLGLNETAYIVYAEIKSIHRNRK